MTATQVDYTAYTSLRGRRSDAELQRIAEAKVQTLDALRAVRARRAALRRLERYRHSGVGP